MLPVCRRWRCPHVKHVRTAIRQSTRQSVNQSINQSVDKSIVRRSLVTARRPRPLEKKKDLFPVPNPNLPLVDGSLADLRAWLHQMPAIEFDSNNQLKHSSNHSNHSSNEQSGRQILNRNYITQRFKDLLTVSNRMTNEFPSQIDMVDYSYIVRHCAILSSLDQSINQSINPSLDESITTSTLIKPHNSDIRSVTQKCCDLAFSIHKLRVTEDWEYSRMQYSFMYDILALAARAGRPEDATSALTSILIMNRSLDFGELLSKDAKPLTIDHANMVVWAYRNQFITQQNKQSSSNTQNLPISTPADHSKFLEFLTKLCSADFDRVPHVHQHSGNIAVGPDTLSMSDPEVKTFVHRSIYQRLRPNAQTLSIILSMDFQLFQQCFSDATITAWFTETLNVTEDTLLMNKMFEYYSWVCHQSINQSEAVAQLINHYQLCRRQGITLSTQSVRIMQNHCGQSWSDQSISPSNDQSTHLSTNKPIHHLVPTGLRFFLQQVAAENPDPSINQLNSLPLDNLLVDRSLPPSQVLAAYEQAISQSITPSSFANLNAIHACFQLSHWQRALQLLTLPNQSSIEVADVTIKQSIDQSNDFYSDPEALHYAGPLDQSFNQSIPDNYSSSINQSINQPVEEIWSIDYWPDLDEWNLPFDDSININHVLSQQSSETTNQSINQPSLVHFVMTIAAMDAAGNRQSISKADQLHALVLEQHPWLIDQSINFSLPQSMLALRLNSIDENAERQIQSIIEKADLDNQSINQARHTLYVDRIWAVLFLSRRLIGRYAAFIASNKQSNNQSINQSINQSEINIFTQIEDSTEAFHSSYLNRLCETHFSQDVMLSFQPVDDPFNPAEIDRNLSISRCLLLIEDSDLAEKAVFEALTRNPFRLGQELKRIQVMKQKFIHQQTHQNQSIKQSSRLINVPKHLFRCILHKDD